MRDAAGADAATYLVFRWHEAEVLEPNGYIDADWRTQGAQMIASVTLWSYSLHVSRAPAVSWLTDATSIARTQTGYALLDPEGVTLATLTDDGPAPTRNDTLTTPDPASSEAGPEFAPAVAGPGTRTVAAGALVGKWRVAGLDPNEASLSFASDGTWSSAMTSFCGLDRLPRIDGFGSYRLLPGGFLLHTDSASVSVGVCANPEKRPHDLEAITMFFEARSVVVSGDHLTLFDQTGKRIGTLTRLR